RPVLEETGLHPLDGQGLDLPGKTAKLQAIELAGLGCHRVAQRPSLKEGGSLSERSKGRVVGQHRRDVPFHEQMGLVVVAVQGDAVMVVGLMDQEAGMMRNARKQPATY